MVEISFIIPVYNGERWILRCISSLQKWNREEQIEIIVVDDGSTDRTGELCEEAAGRDRRLRILHIANSGQGIARNQGLLAATGKYIHFVDADDWVDVERLYLLWQKAEEQKADITMGSYVRVSASREEWVHIPLEGFAGRTGSKKEKALYHSIKTESCFGYVWNKLYRRDFLLCHDLKMDDIRSVYMEDTLFNLKAWSKEPVLYCADIPIYYYVIENVSTTRSADPQIHRKNVEMLRTIIEYLEEENKLEENLDMVVPLIMRTFCWSLIKNTAYEGSSMAKLKERIKAFIDSQPVQRVIRQKESAKYLKPLPSGLQTVFYTICLHLIRWKAEGSCAFLFFCLYPLLKLYTKMTLK